MPEGGTHLTGCRRRRKELCLLPSGLFEGLHVAAFRQGLREGVPRHIKVAEAELTTGGIACEEVTGTLHTLDEHFGKGFPRLIVIGKALEPFTLIQPVFHQLAG